MKTENSEQVRVSNSVNVERRGEPLPLLERLETAGQSGEPTRGANTLPTNGENGIATDPHPSHESARWKAECDAAIRGLCEAVADECEVVLSDFALGNRAAGPDGARSCTSPEALTEAIERFRDYSAWARAWDSAALVGPQPALFLAYAERAAEKANGFAIALSNALRAKGMSPDAVALAYALREREVEIDAWREIRATAIAFTKTGAV